MLSHSAKFGCFHMVHSNRAATRHAVERFRFYHPSEPYIIVCDGGEDFSDLASEFNCGYIHSYIWIGHFNESCQSKRRGHSKITGFAKDEVLHWLHLFRDAARIAKSSECTHLLMMEDDILINGTIVIDKSWQIAGHGKEASYSGNVVNRELSEYLIRHHQTWIDWYGAAGGTIFNIDTFLDNYHRIYDFIDFEFEAMESLDNRFGVLDLYMHVIYLVLGKKYERNTNLVDAKEIDEKDFEQYTIVHGYKALYDDVR